MEKNAMGEGRMYEEKASFSKILGCKYIHLQKDEFLIFRGKSDKLNACWEGEYVITKDNLLICVTANSLEAIEKEVRRGVMATGYIQATNIRFAKITDAQI